MNPEKSKEIMSTAGQYHLEFAEQFSDCDNGACFSKDRSRRYGLWRTWDSGKPRLMCIGLNPSTANETHSDPTIKSICRIARNNGYGSIMMVNCFPMVSADPKKLEYDNEDLQTNDEYILAESKKCQDILFAWGNFDVVSETGRDVQLKAYFPNARALGINKNGSPKHPLYCKSNSVLMEYCVKNETL